MARAGKRVGVSAENQRNPTTIVGDDSWGLPVLCFDPQLGLRKERKAVSRFSTQAHIFLTRPVQSAL